LKIEKQGGKIFMNKENKVTLYQMIKEIINNNQLTAMEEAEIRKMLEEKGKKEEDVSKSCLAAIIEKEIEEGLKIGKYNEFFKNRNQPIIEKYFKKSKIGNMSVADLSETDIQKFILQAKEVYQLNKDNMICFMGLLQIGLNVLAERNMLKFVPDKHLFRNYLGKVRGINYIDNPFSSNETALVREWINRHPKDIRGLAVGLWLLSGDISIKQIVNLKKKKCNGDVLNKWSSKKIIEKALQLNPEDEEYVFMVKKEGRWTKLTVQGVQMKLYYICEEIGIEHKRIHRDDAVLHNITKLI